MTDSITRQEWQQLQDKINRIEAAITGGIEGLNGGLRGRVESLERRLVAIEENRGWLFRTIVVAVISAGISIFISFVVKH